MRSIKVGNAAIDGEVIGKNWKIAIEIKSGHDDVIRGLGQLTTALAHGYNSAVLVISQRRARRLDLTVFNKLSIAVLGVNSRARIKQIFTNE
jgi:hypothetical protein